MKLTIIKDDSNVGIDGVFKKVDLSTLDPNIRAIQWNGTKGHIEFYEGLNKPLQDILQFSSFIDLWNAVVPPKETPVEVPVVVQTLDEAKLAQRKLLNETRDGLEASGFLYLGKLFDSDERSALRITMAALTAQLSLTNDPPFTIDWTTQDNSILTLTAQEVIEMPRALAIHGLTLHSKGKALKKLLDKATTTTEVKDIKW